MWLSILSKEVEAKGSPQVAKELGVSRSTIDLVVQGKYQASTQKVEDRVKAIYGKDGHVQCAVLGVISPNTCAEKWTLAKKIGMMAGNPETLKLYKTCLNCSVRKG
jgi:hypothetical protein